MNTFTALMILASVAVASAEEHAYSTLAPVDRKEITRIAVRAVAQTYPEVDIRALRLESISFSCVPGWSQESVRCTLYIPNGRVDGFFTKKSDEIHVSIAPGSNGVSTIAYRQWDYNKLYGHVGKKVGGYPKLAPVQSDRIENGARGLVLKTRPDLSADDLVFDRIKYEYTTMSPVEEFRECRELLTAEFYMKQPSQTFANADGTLGYKHETFTVESAYRDRHGRWHPASCDVGTMTRFPHVELEPAPGLVPSKAAADGGL